MPEWIVSVVIALLLAVQAGGPGSAQGAPIATSAAPEAAANVGAYLTDIAPALGRLGEGAGAMAELMAAPAIGDPDWQARAAGSFAAVRDAHGALLAYEPAQALGAVHGLLTEATGHCASGAQTAASALEEGKVMGLYAAAQLVTTCAGGSGGWRAQVEECRE